jgi:hypothetical protein
MIQLINLHNRKIYYDTLKEMNDMVINDNIIQ